MKQAKEKIVMQPKVSIIIPVWSDTTSDGSLLRRVFDCCANQTMQEIEIVAVNDKSPNPLDYNIMEEYESKYPSLFRCLYLPENIRQGGARNRGIDAAKGEYVMFIDDDDTVDLTMCEKLYDAAVSADADIAVCAWKYRCGDEMHAGERSYRIEKWYNIQTTPWAKIICREMLIRNNYYFAEVSHMEDLVAFLWAANSRKTVYINEFLYFWCLRDDSCSLGGKLCSNNDFNGLIPAYNYFLGKINLISKTDIYTVSTLFIVKHFTHYLNKYYRSCDTKTREKYYIQYKILISQISIHKLTKPARRLLSRVWDDFGTIDCIKNNTERLRFFSEWIDETLLVLKQYNFKAIITEICAYLKIISFDSICLWGSGKNGTFVSEILVSLSIHHETTDINPETYNRLMPNNKEVKPWEKIKKNVKTIIICTSKHYSDVRNTVGQGYLLVDIHKYLNSNDSPEEYINKELLYYHAE